MTRNILRLIWKFTHNPSSWIRTYTSFTILKSTLQKTSLYAKRIKRYFLYLKEKYFEKRFYMHIYRYLIGEAGVGTMQKKFWYSKLATFACKYFKEQATIKNCLQLVSNLV